VVHRVFIQLEVPSRDELCR